MSSVRHRGTQMVPAVRFAPGGNDVTLLGEMELRLRSDNLIEILGPTNVATGAAITSPSAVTARVYDLAKSSVIAALTFEVAAAVTSGAVVTVTDYGWEADLASWVNVTDRHLVMSGDNRIQIRTPDTITPATPSFTYNTGFAETVAAGSIITQDEVGAGTQLPVRDAVFESSDSVDIELSDGTLFSATVNSVADKPSKAPQLYPQQALTLGSSLTAAALIGARVRRLLGTASMTLFNSSTGTNAADADDWGFRGTIDDTLVGVLPGMRVGIDVVFNGGAGLQVIESRTARVV